MRRATCWRRPASGQRHSGGALYQRLTVEAGEPRYSLHGLVAVWLTEYGWYRIDARGNKPGVEAQFCPPLEKLAFPITYPGEADLPEIWSEPLPVVVAAYENRQRTIKCIKIPSIENCYTVGDCSVCCRTSFPTRPTNVINSFRRNARRRERDT